MDVIYPYRRSGDGSELKFSLRSLRNVPHDNVWVVGEQERWFSKEVRFIRRQQSSSKWQNARENIIAAAKHPDISEDFILMNDDFFVMSPIPKVPTLHRGPIDDFVEARKKAGKVSGYVMGLVETKALLEWAGCTDTLYSYSLHVPFVFNKTKLLTSLDYLRSIRPAAMPNCFHLRTWYGNYWQIGGTQMRDVKINSYKTSVPDGPFLSTDNASFTTRSVVRERIVSTFPDRSPYER